MRTMLPLWITLATSAFLAAPACADDSQGAQTTQATETESSQPTYTLRYKFHPGETIRWDVLQQSRVRATVSGTTQVTETVTKSVKAWRVTDAKPDGTATFEHVVESVDMRNKFSGREEIRYNSQTDEEPAPGYEDVAESIGLPLATVTMNSQGEILRRQRKPLKAAARNEEGFEIVCAQVGQQFHHGLVGELVVGPVEPRMLRRSQPLAHTVGEFTGRQAGAGQGHDAENAPVVVGKQGGQVAGQGGLHRGVILPGRILRQAAFQFVQGEIELERHRILRPEGAVIVEDGNTIGRRDKVAGIVAGNFGDEVDDGFFGLGVLPRSKGHVGFAWRPPLVGGCGGRKEAEK